MNRNLFPDNIVEVSFSEYETIIELEMGPEISKNETSETIKHLKRNMRDALFIAFSTASR